MIRIIIVILILCSLYGCTAKTAFFYPNENGEMEKVAEVWQSSNGTASYNPTTKEVTIDTRQVSWFERNIVPILSGTIDRAAKAR